MKIHQLKTHMGVRAGTPKAETNFTLEAHSMHKGLVMTPHVHPELGAGIMIETAQLKAKGKVSFCPINNVEEIIFTPEESAKRGPGRPKAVE